MPVGQEGFRPEGATIRKPRVTPHMRDGHDGCQYYGQNIPPNQAILGDSCCPNSDVVRPGFV